MSCKAFASVLKGNPSSIISSRSFSKIKRQQPTKYQAIYLIDSCEIFLDGVFSDFFEIARKDLDDFVQKVEYQKRRCFGLREMSAARSSKAACCTCTTERKKRVRC